MDRYLYLYIEFERLRMATCRKRRKSTQEIQKHVVRNDHETAIVAKPGEIEMSLTVVKTPHRQKVKTVKCLLDGRKDGRDSLFVSIDLWEKGAPHERKELLKIDSVYGNGNPQYSRQRR